MEGKGAYNRHAKSQASGVGASLCFWENALHRIAFLDADRPIVIADYGSSQGRNSSLPMRTAIKVLRSRLGPDRPILVYHIDLPANDFNALFDELQNDPNRYAADEPNVFPCAVGRSFYGRVLPYGHVDLGWSSYAAMWLSRIPALIPGHFYPGKSTGAVRARFEQQGASDWATFLELRSAELRPGGRLMVVVAGADENESSGFGGIMEDANAVLEAMVDARSITAEERARMVLGTWARRKTDLLAPFGHNGRFHGLTVEHCDMSGVEDTAWVRYQIDQDGEALARGRAAFFRSTFAPSLARALTAGEDPGAAQAFSERLEQGLRERAASRRARQATRFPCPRARAATVRGRAQTTCRPAPVPPRASTPTDVSIDLGLPEMPPSGIRRVRRRVRVAETPRRDRSNRAQQATLPAPRPAFRATYPGAPTGARIGMRSNP